MTHIKHKTYGTIYFFLQLNINNKILFPIKANRINQLHKQDRRHVNQYNATRQFQMMNKEFVLSRIMGKMENYIDNTYCKHFEEKDKTVFLTKRINKNDTIISWEIGTFMESEKRQMFEFNKHSKKYKIHKPKPYVKDDKQ